MAVFSQYYQTQFKLTQGLADDEMDITAMNKMADILGQAYVAFRQQKFDETVIQRLDQDALVYIDYNLFKQAYQALYKAGLK